MVGGAAFGAACLLANLLGASFSAKLLAKWPICAMRTLKMGFSSLGNVE